MTTDTTETKRFFCGVRQCGCVTATAIDGLAEAEYAEFQRDMFNSDRRTEWRDLTYGQFLDTFKPCAHTVGHNDRNNRRA